MTLSPVVSQWDASRCAPANCGPATAAWMHNCAKPDATPLTGEQMRLASGYDCLSHPKAPGFFSSTIVKVLALKGVESILWAGTGTMDRLKDWTDRGGVAAILGDYDALEGTPFEKSEAFQGDHWGGIGKGYQWADPIKRTTTLPILPADLVEKFWLTVRKGTKLPTGFAVLVKTPEFQEPDVSLFITTTYYPAPRRFRIGPGTFTAYTKGTGKLVESKTQGFANESGASASADVQVSTGGPASAYVLVKDGAFAGMLLRAQDVRLEDVLVPVDATATIAALQARIDAAKLALG